MRDALIWVMLHKIGCACPFESKLSCNPDLWNPRESRMDGKSREAVEINGRLENLLLSIQSAYQTSLFKGCPFDAIDVKELF